MAEGSAKHDIIEVPDDEHEDFPNSGPQKLTEAQTYHNKINHIMDTFSKILDNDWKDTLRQTVTSLRKLMAKHWRAMAKADVDVVMKAVHDLGCVYLWQHLTPDGVDVTEPTAEIPVAWEFIRQLSEKKHKTEVKDLITTAFDHLSDVHTHMSSYAVNMSSLTKIVDPDMFQAVLKATAHPLIQVNIPNRYLNPVEEPQPKTTAEERLQKLEKVLLLRARAAYLVRELRYGLTRLLATAVWLHLKCKYFNSGMAKEACEAFEVRVKQLSKPPSKEKEGPKQCLKHKKSVKAQSAIKEGDDNE